MGEVVRFISRQRSDLFEVTPTGLVGVQPQRHARQTAQTNSPSCADRRHNLCVPVCAARSAVANKRRSADMLLTADKLTNKISYNFCATSRHRLENKEKNSTFCVVLTTVIGHYGSKIFKFQIFVISCMYQISSKSVQLERN